MIHYHKPECFAKTKKKITAFKVKVTVKVRMSMFVQMILSELPNILLPKVQNVNECLPG